MTTRPDRLSTGTPTRADTATKSQKGTPRADHKAPLGIPLVNALGRPKSPAELARAVEVLLDKIAKRFAGEIERLGRFFDAEGFYDDGRVVLEHQVEDLLAPGAAALDPRTVCWLFDDFTAIGGYRGFTSSASGFLAAVSHGTGESLRPGVLNLTTGTTTTGRAGILSALTSVLLTAEKARFLAAVKLEDLGDATDRININVGLADSISGTPGNGIFFSYQDNASSGNWRANTRETATGSGFIDTGIPVKSGQWYELEIAIDARTGVALFYIDRTQVARMTANVPTGVAMAVVAGNIRKLTGTTERLLYLDYCAYRQDFGQRRGT